MSQCIERTGLYVMRVTSTCVACCVHLMAEADPAYDVQVLAAKAEVQDQLQWQIEAGPDQGGELVLHLQEKQVEVDRLQVPMLAL